MCYAFRHRLENGQAVAVYSTPEGYLAKIETSEGVAPYRYMHMTTAFLDSCMVFDNPEESLAAMIAGLCKLNPGVVPST
jgi:hypothetical protein